MESVLILSKWSNAISVALIVDRLRDRGLRSVLITPSVDRNCNKCDDHVLLDWDSDDLPTLVTRLDRRGIDPVAVVNPVELLNSWQIAVATHYGLPGADSFRDLLASKIRVRDHMRAIGLSAIRFCRDPAEVDFFPAIVKPSRVSSASWLVRRVDSPAELFAYQRHLAELGLAETELIIEEYLPGTEFQLDGPAVGGRFYPVAASEKPDHDNTRHHDAGLIIHPPQQDHVRDGVRALSEMIDALCADLRLDQIWLHVEARTAEGGRAEVVEINPRPPAPGRFTRVYRETSGIDQMEVLISMSLGQYTIASELPDPLRERPLFGTVAVEAEELGIVEIRTTEDDIRALPGVIDAHVINGFQISSLEKENFFICFALTADSVSQLRTRAATVLSTLDYHITAEPELSPVLSDGSEGISP